MCERCNAVDGREVCEYTVKNAVRRTLCLPCALLTAQVHDISPQPEAPEPEPPEAQEAEAKGGGEAQPQGEEPTEPEEAGGDGSSAPEPEPPEAQEAEAKPKARRRRTRN